MDILLNIYVKNFINRAGHLSPIKMTLVCLNSTDNLQKLPNKRDLSV